MPARQINLSLLMRKLDDTTGTAGSARSPRGESEVVLNNSNSTKINN